MKNPSKKFERILLIIFLAGVVDLALQIIAGRMLTPYFGSSVYTWGSVIGVLMTTLSLGYYVGGMFSKKSTNTTISQILFFAVASIGLIIFIGTPLLRFVDSWSIPIQYAAIPAVFLLFGPASFLVGMLTPIAVKRVSQKEKGEAAGQVFAVGTIGSIVGAFGATFFLIPLFSLNTSLLILGLLLLATTILALSNKREYIIVTALCIFLLSTVVVDQANTVFVGEEVYQTQTPYQELEVRDVNGIRNLYLDGQLQSGMRLDDILDHVYSYTNYVEIPLLLNPDIETVLFIGGGGFSGPRILAERDLEITVVELDPGVVSAAKDYFFIDETKMDIHVEDGREFLESTNQTYDLIILDAYRKDRVPFHMTTIEFYNLVDSKLSEDAILLSNLIASPTGAASLFYRTSYKTLRTVFPNTYVFRTRESDVIQNIELLAVKRNVAIPRTGVNKYGVNVNKELNFLVTEVDITGVDILLDNKAPVDTLLKSVANEEFVLR